MSPHVHFECQKKNHVTFEMKNEWNYYFNYVYVYKLFFLFCLGHGVCREKSRECSHQMHNSFISTKNKHFGRGGGIFRGVNEIESNRRSTQEQSTMILARGILCMFRERKIKISPRSLAFRGSFPHFFLLNESRTLVTVTVIGSLAVIFN